MQPLRKRSSWGSETAGHDEQLFERSSCLKGAAEGRELLLLDLLLLGEVGGHEEERVNDEDDPGDDAEGAEGQARVPVEGRLK